MPRLTGWARVRRSIWASLSSAPARLILSPSICSKWPRNCCHSAPVGGAVFLGRAQGAGGGQECQVAVDHFLVVGGFVAEGDVDVAVPGDDLGGVRGQAGEETGSERFTNRVECLRSRGSEMRDLVLGDAVLPLPRVHQTVT